MNRFLLLFAPLAMALRRPTSWQNSVTIRSDSPCSVQFKTIASVSLVYATMDHCSGCSGRLFLDFFVDLGVGRIFTPLFWRREVELCLISSPTEAVAVVG